MEQSPPWVYFHFPDVCKGVEIVVGVDEAGRGPVLGPLVYSAAFWPVSEDEQIKKLAFDDSKQLKEGERETLFNQIRSHGSIGYVVEELTASRVSKEMLRINPTSLNSISYDAVVRMLRKIAYEVKPAPRIRTVYVDTVGDPEFYKSRLVNALGDDFAEFIIEKKADATYKTVSAASIVAKVTRDTIVSNWKWESPGIKYDTDFGSGYPGDERCVNWLARSQHPVFGYPNIVRFSWSTTREVLISGKACTATWDCDEDESNGNILNYFAAPGAKKTTKRPKRSAFFVQRKMKHVAIEDLLS